MVKTIHLHDNNFDMISTTMNAGFEILTNFPQWKILKELHVK